MARQQSASNNKKAQLAEAYQSLTAELSSPVLHTVGNYTLARTLGSGSFGLVRLASHRLLSSCQVAVKSVPKSHAQLGALTREIHHHRRLSHPHVARLLELIPTERDVHLVSELCAGGELYDYLVERGRLAEDEARRVFGQLMLAVGYLHSQGVVHRDLKLENVLLDMRGDVKLGDFGFAREFEEGTGRWMETWCGTTGYAAPEMLRGEKYSGPEVDIWSSGIILYTLLTGGLPFDNDDEEAMKADILKGEFYDPEWLTDDARDLIRSILVLTPSSRPSIPTILSHPWFTRHPPQSPPPAHLTPPHPAPASRPATPPPAHEHSASESSYYSAAGSSSGGWDVGSGVTTPTTTAEDEKPEAGFLPPLPDTGGFLPLLEPEDARSGVLLHHYHANNESQTTLRREDLAGEGPTPKAAKHAQVLAPTSEEDLSSPALRRTPSSSSSLRHHMISSATARTPSRTKRRSVSSTLSELPPLTPLPLTSAAPKGPDYLALLRTPQPAPFEQEWERALLRSLGDMGFDVGQIRHSVRNCACDAASGLWWLMWERGRERRRERGEDGAEAATAESPVATAVDSDKPKPPSPTRPTPTPAAAELASTSSPLLAPSPSPLPSAPLPLLALNGAAAHSAPALTAPITPQKTPRSPPPPVPPTSPGTGPGTPTSPRKGKARSSSISMLQRATTALGVVGAAGVLTRKKSDERERSPTPTQGVLFGSVVPTPSEEGTSGMASPAMERMDLVPDGATEGEGAGAQTAAVASTSALASGPAGAAQAAPAVGTSGWGTGGSGGRASASGSKGSGGRERGSLLNTFKMWFNEDKRKQRKRKPTAPPAPSDVPFSPYVAVNEGRHRRSSSLRSQGSRADLQAAVRRGSVPFSAAPAPVLERPPNSRRSSSVHSRRSSVASVHQLQQQQPHDSSTTATQRRRSAGAGAGTSRPASVGSLNLRKTHSKSPSASSASSASRMTHGHGRAGTASPLQAYHARAGSASSSTTTRVMRQIHPAHSHHHHRHRRTASGASSVSSSRASSVYESPVNILFPASGGPASEGIAETDEGAREDEGEGKQAQEEEQEEKLSEAPALSQYPSTASSSIRSASFDRPRPPPLLQAPPTVLVAHKNRSPFAPPTPTFGSGGRAGWRRAWQPSTAASSSTPAPLATGTDFRSSSPTKGFPHPLLGLDGRPRARMARDVFGSSPQGADDPDWVDEEEGGAGDFAGGMGQPGGGFSARHSSSVLHDPPPRPKHQKTKSGSLRAAAAAASAPASSSAAEEGQGHLAQGSPAGRTVPLPQQQQQQHSPPGSGAVAVGVGVSRRSVPAQARAAARPAAVIEEEEEEEEVQD